MTQAVSVEQGGAVKARSWTEVVVVPVLKCSTRPAVENGHFNCLFQNTQQSEMEKRADGADASVLFFSCAVLFF